MIIIFPNTALKLTCYWKDGLIKTVMRMEWGPGGRREAAWAGSLLTGKGQGKYGQSLLIYEAIKIN